MKLCDRAECHIFIPFLLLLFGVFFQVIHKILFRVVKFRASHKQSNISQHTTPTLYIKQGLMIVVVAEDAAGVKVNILGFSWVMGDANWKLYAKGCLYFFDV